MVDFYTLLKFLHVALAIIWLGGTLAGGLFGVWVWRRGTVADMGLVMRQSGWLAGAVFGPATLAVPALGAWMAWQHYDFTQAWIVLALAAVVVHLGIGYGVVMPRFKALEGTAREGRLAEVDRAPFGWLMRMGMAHEVMLQAVVLDMVAKPQWSDTGLVGAIVIIAVLGFAHMAIPISK
jgi:uncharacterized membrane protein